MTGQTPHPLPGPAGWACPCSGSPRPPPPGAPPATPRAPLPPAPAAHRAGRSAQTTSVHTGVQSHMIGPAGLALTSAPAHLCPPCLPAVAAGPISPSAVHVTLPLPGRGSESLVFSMAGPPPCLLASTSSVCSSSPSPPPGHLGSLRGPVYEPWCSFLTTGDDGDYLPDSGVVRIRDGSCGCCLA